MNVLVRADASSEIGGGHIGRCIALAEAINARGGETVFATRQDAVPGHRMLDSAGIPYFKLPCSANWQGDAEATRTLLGGRDWVVVDHHGLDARWQKSVAQDRVGVLVIDDLADRRHDCAVLTDAGRADSAQHVYADLAPGNCSFLLGPRFALLRREFRAVPSERPQRARPNLLVFFGSADGQGLTELALDALEDANLQHELSVHVVLTAANPRSAEIRNREDIHVHADVSDMAALVSDMDIAMGAGGVSLWERCSLGVPSLTIGLNENQLPGVQLAETAGAIRSIGLTDAQQPKVFAKAIRDFVAARGDWPSMASSGRGLVDGRGADRVAAYMGALKLRAVIPDDCDLLWRWANDPDVRAMAFDTAAIPLEDHRAWFASKNDSGASLMLIAEHDAVPAGQVRFDRSDDDGGWLIDISLAPKFRGKNMALELLQKALVIFRHAHIDVPAIAWVKTGNVPSVRLFEAAGFRRDTDRPEASRYIYR